MSVYVKEKAEYLKQAMESIWNQTIQTDDFVLVCDGTLTKELDAVIDEMEEAHDELHVVRLEKNGGLGNALNEGIKYCKNEIVARMDSDDISRPDRCEKQLHVFSSLGVRRYLSLMKHAEFVLGNSSSGIIETPAFHIPTVNIGDRQRGRLQSDSIINCPPDTGSIVDAIKKACSAEHRAICYSVVSPYGDGHAAERIAVKTVEIVKSGEIDLKKRFYNIKL